MDVRFQVRSYDVYGGRFLACVLLFVAATLPVRADRIFFACHEGCALRTPHTTTVVADGCFRLTFAQPVQSNVRIERDKFQHCGNQKVTAVVEIVTAADGKVQNASVLKPIACMTSGAIERLIREMQFEPASIDGVPRASVESVAVSVDPEHGLIRVAGNRCLHECAIEQVREVDREVRTPTLVTRAEPEASSAAPCRGLVSLRLLIDSCGSVRKVEDRSRNPDAFTRSWAEAAHGWKFRPATLRGEAIAVWWFIHINIKCA